MTLVRRAMTLFASLALSLALAAPATAAASKDSVPAWACSPEDVATAAAAGGAVARGPAVDSQGRVREKDTGQIAKDLPASAKSKAPASFSVTVPVWWHVITDGDAGDLSDADIRNQIRVMSNAFAGGAGGAATGFTFDLVGITRTDDAVWYRLQSAGAEHEMKKALKRGDDGTLNVYSGAAGGYLGYAYLPEITDTAQAYLDGIVIDWETLPGVSDTYGGGYADEGDTMVHETGHWLNLEHTFFGQCNKSGDFVDDTPKQKWASSGCPVDNDTCPAPGLDPIHNYMDYSDDSCIFEFTPGQAQRMRDAWLFWRAPA
jgi:Pregnancy-associated plasma protein-A